MTHSLSDLTALLKHHGLVREEPGSASVSVTGIADDSRKVRAGNLFVAVDGTEADGHGYVAAAVAAGAAAVVVERPCDVDVPQVEVGDSRTAAGFLAAEIHGNPGRDMQVMGVTGTNGKTTTVALARHILSSNGPTGSLGTLGAIGADGHKLAGTPPLTTPGPVELQSLLAGFRDGGVATVVMEVSSHALSQSRVAGMSFDAALFTNLTHEHLDYHPDLADYLKAKLRLIDYLSPGGIVAANADSPAWSQLIAERAGCVTFSVGKEATVSAQNVNPELAGARFDLVIDDRLLPVSLPLAGEFNVANAAAAAALGVVAGVDPGEIADRLSGAPQVPGRMEVLHRGEYVVLRDYAHTPDAYQRVLSTLKRTTAGRLVMLFGCGGDRDRQKRPLLAASAAEIADIVFITTDNPRTEDPERIFSDMKAGLADHAYFKVDDREEAIGRAIEMLQPGDTLLLAGKGHETYQLIGGERIPFDEKAIVENLLGTS